MERIPYIEVESIKALPHTLENTVYHYAFQYIDFNEAFDYAVTTRFVDCCFLGCVIPQEMQERMKSCLVLPRMGRLYKAFANSLYTGETLYSGYDVTRPETAKTCFDARVYEDYMEHGKFCNDIRETLTRTIHDHAMNNAMHDLLDQYSEKDIVGIMGGHAMLRTDEAYAKVVCISKTLTEHGKFMISGGGPGAMEATHLGAWMAGRSDDDVRDALQILSIAPSFRDEGWLESAFQVKLKYPQKDFRSLGLPTWFYGHEPATPFATDIAKFFDNSVRENGIISIARGGIIYSPGSAGTMREIFQDAEKNHYQTLGSSSPMVFLGVDYYTNEMPVYSYLQELSQRGKFKNLFLSITDDASTAIRTILDWE